MKEKLQKLPYETRVKLCHRFNLCLYLFKITVAALITIFVFRNSEAIISHFVEPINLVIDLTLLTKSLFVLWLIFCVLEYLGQYADNKYKINQLRRSHYNHYE